MKNPKFKTHRLQTHIAEPADENSPLAKVHALERAKTKAFAFSKISDSVAQSDHWFRNEPIPGGLDLFPMQWYMRYADLFYPLAVGGKLYIDTPMSGSDINFCKMKMAAYHKKGIRYTYIAQSDGPEEVLMRLDGVNTQPLPTGALACR